MSTTPVPVLNTQVIGRAESALGAILDPLLARAGISFPHWLVFVVTSAASASAGSDVVSQDLVVSRIVSARKISEADVRAAIGELADAGLAAVKPGADPTVRLTEAGAARFAAVRLQVEEITARLFDLPEQDLVTAGRVLSIVTARANAEIAAALD